VGPRKHVLGGVHTGASWRIPLNRSRAACCQITLTKALLASLCHNFFVQLKWNCKSKEFNKNIT